MIVRIDIQFAVEEGESTQHGYGKSIQIERTPPVCNQCGQDHKMNVEMNVWGSPNGPCTKTRHESFTEAYAVAKKQFPELP